MTIYARADLDTTSISAEGHGGCGETHIRPVVDGAPVRIWALDCSACENYLRHDPLWSVTTTEIPETYDDAKAREQSEKAGKMDRERQLAVALEQLSPLGQLPEVMARLLSQLAGTGAPDAPAALAGQMECPSGHVNQPGHKFCSQCGQAMSQRVAAAALPAAQAHAEPQQAGKRPPRLRDQPKAVLKALAATRGLDTDGTNGELVTRLSNAGVTGNDLAAYLDGQLAAA